MLNKLTAKAVANAKPGFHADGGNLYLSVGKGDAKSWVVRIKVGGKIRDIGIGSLRDVTLADAREKAGEVRKQVAAGVDPVAERKRAKTMTFDAAANACLADIEPGWKNPRIAERWRQILAEPWMKKLCAVEVATVGLADVKAALLPVWSAKPTTGQFARGMIERVLSWSIAHGHRPAEAGTGCASWRDTLRHVMPRPVKGGHNEAMPYTQVGAFVRSLRDRKGSARLLEFIALTGVRKGEASPATWAEFDLVAGLWTIPAGRMKSGVSHTVPLSKQALLLVLGQPRGDDLVFPSAPAKPFDAAATNRLMPRPYTVHGLRSAFRDFAGDRTDHPREIAEMALAHRVGDATELAYRRGTALERRRQLMQEWADFIDA
jgi:integrase